jgi:nitrous oxidase accessory protein NosD
MSLSKVCLLALLVTCASGLGCHSVNELAPDGALWVGVQPVADTPVEALPNHPGHEPILQLLPPEPATQPKRPTPTREWYVSPTGNDSNAGTQASPFRTISRAVLAVSAGERVHVLAGTYAEKVLVDANAREGRADAPIVLQGEGKPKIVPVSTGAGAMVQIARPAWIVDGFDIDARSLPEFAVAFTGNTEGSTLANCEIHHGALGAGVTTFSRATGVVIENNHIHHFSRGGIDSHGIVVQPTSRNITVRHNDIHDNSGDSVQCLGPEGYSALAPADGLLIEGNHLYANRENGVDIKTCKNVVIRGNRMHGFRMSTSSAGDAIVIHMSAAQVLVEGNDLYDAGKGIALGGNHVGPVPTGVIIRRNLIHDLLLTGGMEGTGIRVENAERPQILHNTMVRIAGPALRLGGGTGGATNAAVVRNNILDAAVIVRLGTMAPGLAMDRNFLRAGAIFNEYVSGGLVELDLARWRAKGLDTSSITGSSPLVDPASYVPAAVAVDRGLNVGLPFCGAGPDLGAVESDC